MENPAIDPVNGGRLVRRHVRRCGEAATRLCVRLTFPVCRNDAVRAEGEKMERALFYVAITRAKC